MVTRMQRRRSKKSSSAEACWVVLRWGVVIEVGRLMCPLRKDKVKLKSKTYYGWRLG